jgi:hypothetical protein
MTVDPIQNAATTRTAAQGPTPTDFARAGYLEHLAQKGTPEQIASALQGKDSSLGVLTDTEKRNLVSKSIDTWDSQMKGWNYGKGVSENLKKSETLLNLLKGDTQLSSLAKDEMAKKPLNVVMFYHNHDSDTGSGFDRAALTYGREHKSDIYIPFRTKEDFRDNWNLIAASGRTVSNVAYFGHSGKGVLDFARTAPDNPNSQLSNDDISKLAKLNYASGATIDLHSCESADGPVPVASIFAKTQRVPTIGRNGFSSFSTAQNRFIERDAAFQQFKERFMGPDGDIPANWNGKLYLEAYYRSKNSDNPESLEALGLLPDPYANYTPYEDPYDPRDPYKAHENEAIPTTTFYPLAPAQKLRGPI